MMRVFARQLCIAGVVMLLLAIACRFGDLNAATAMVDNLAIIVNAVLVVVTGGYGWFSGRGERDRPRLSPDKSSE